MTGKKAFFHNIDENMKGRVKFVMDLQSHMKARVISLLILRMVKS